MERRQIFDLIVGTVLASSLLVGCGPVGGGGGGGGGGNGHPSGGDGCAAFADEYGSEITEDTTVTQGSCLKVDDRVMVSGGQLTVESGVTLFFAENASLSVGGNGALTTSGSASSPVVLTGQTESPGSWVGVAIGTDSGLNALEHTTIEYAGASEEVASLTVGNGAKAAIDNTTVRHGANVGLQIGEKTELPSFADNTFSDNGSVPIKTHASAIAQLDSSAVFGDNADSHVLVTGGVVNGDEENWPGLAVPYQVEGSVRIEGGDTKVTVEAGATFQFAEKTFLAVRNGVFVVAGTADNKVTFTGTNQMKGWWVGLVMQDTDRAGNKIEHAVIEYGGHQRDPFSASFCLHCDHNPSNLQLVGARGAVSVAIDNVTIRNGSEAGVFADGGVDITSFKNNTLSDNDNGSVQIHARQIADMDASSSYGSDLRVMGGAADHEEAVNWPALDADYMVEGNLEVRKTATKVTVQPGATFKFAEQKWMVVAEGEFVAKGTADEKVTFKGSSAMKGWWSGITFHETDRAANALEHVVIEHGGNDKGPFRAAFCLHCDHHPSNLQLHGERGPVTISLKNVSLNSSSGAGMYADGEVSFSACTGISISDCASSVEGATSQVTSTCSL